jgi:threonine synthase
MSGKAWSPRDKIEGWRDAAGDGGSLMHFEARADRESGETYFHFAEPFALPSDGNIRSMWRYRTRFPLDPSIVAMTLGEGGTPLIESGLFPGIQFCWKDETRDPTGSHKDRALSIAAAHAQQF